MAVAATRNDKIDLLACWVLVLVLASCAEVMAGVGTSGSLLLLPVAVGALDLEAFVG